MGQKSSSTAHNNLKSDLIKNACYVGKKSTITLNLQNRDGSPFSVPLSLVSCELSCADDSQLISCDINETQSGNYDISFTPQTRGKHQLTIQLEGVNIPNSPFTLHITKMRGKPVNIISGLCSPYGVVFTKNEEIIVADGRDCCVTILDKEGKKVKSFGTYGTKEGQFNLPYAVAISHDGHILVSDRTQLQKLTFEGECVKSVRVYDPRGIAVHPTTGQIYVTDTENLYIQVFNEDLTHYYNFGGYDCYGIFNHPWDLVFDNEGYLYFTDRSNHCVKKFTSKGDFVSAIGSEGSEPGQLKDPSFIVIDKDLLYVSEYGKNLISVFDTNGCFIHCFAKECSGEEKWDDTSGMAVDSLGNLYITENWKKRLIVL